MNLSVEQLLVQIIKFLETDQPSMATLYMKKALALLEEQRLLAVGATIFDVFVSIQTSVADYFKALAEAFSNVLGCNKVPAKSDFALVPVPLNFSLGAEK